MEDLDVGKIIITFVVFLLSLTVHECAHAWAAERSGDSTGRYLGRVTLNPIPHIDPFGTILFPLISMIYGFGMFGWAKPVPFNPLNLRERRLGEIVIALAGPMSNVALAILFILLYKVLFQTSTLAFRMMGGLLQPIETMIEIGIFLNIVLAVFNLIPIPPLDGHHVVRNLLPDSLAELYSQIPPWMGFILLILLTNVGFTGALVQPIFALVIQILN